MSDSLGEGPPPPSSEASPGSIARWGRRDRSPELWARGRVCGPPPPGPEVQGSPPPPGSAWTQCHGPPPQPGPPAAPSWGPHLPGLRLLRPWGPGGERRGRAPAAPLTSLRRLPPRLLDVLLRLIAQLDLQLLGLHLQVPLPLREGLPGLGSNDTGKLLTGPRARMAPRGTWPGLPFAG